MQRRYENDYKILGRQTTEIERNNRHVDIVGVCILIIGLAVCVLAVCFMLAHDAQSEKEQQAEQVEQTILICKYGSIAAYN